MKALMIGGQMHAMKGAILFGAHRDSIQEILHHRNLIRMKDGSEVHMCVIRSERDVEYLRGLHFDWIIEHKTFPKSIYLLQLVRAVALRLSA